MNEITRVHLAKVAYDIELSAKKELEDLFQKLKALDTIDYTNILTGSSSNCFKVCKKAAPVAPSTYVLCFPNKKRA